MNKTSTKCLGLLMISTQYLRILFYIGRTYPTTWDKHVTMVTSTITLQMPGAPDVVGWRAADDDVMSSINPVGGGGPWEGGHCITTCISSASTEFQKAL